VNKKKRSTRKQKKRNTHAAKQALHNNICASLEQRLLNSTIQYHNIITEHEYYDTTNKVDGECDVHAYYDNKHFGATGKAYLLLFEVKCTDNHKGKKKAIQQLKKDEAHYKANVYTKVDEIKKFYVHGNKDNTYSIKQIK